MIEYKRDGDKMDLRRPVAGRWTAMVGGLEVCEVEVTEGTIEEWERLCALDVAHLLPGDCDPVVLRWLVTGDEGLRESARDAATKAAAWAATWAATWAAWAAAGAAAGPGSAAGDATWAAAGGATWLTSEGEGTQRAHIDRLIWTAHGETLTMRERIDLSRDLRYRGEEEAAAAVLPAELREVTA